MAFVFEDEAPQSGRFVFEDEQPTQEAAQPQETGMLDRLGRATVDTGKGLLKGAADIGATILSPFDYAGLSAYSPSERRAALEQFAQENASPAFTGGEIAAQIAGTAGAGGALAQGVRRAAPLVPEAAAALESGGMAKGLNLGQRLAGGAVSGGAMSGMVNPQEAATGAAIGAALPAGVQAATRGIPAIAREVAGVTSGVGGTPLSEAYQAGKAGGAKAQAFRENITGRASMSDALESAKGALENMRQARGAQYKASIGASFRDPKTLDISPIIDDFNKQVSTLRVKGAQGSQAWSVGENELKPLKEVQDILQEWSAKPDLHTVEGFDALKRRIGAVYPESPKQVQAQRIIDSMYNSVKRSIETQAKGYSETMRDYSRMTDQIREIEKSLSLGNKASADTAMRKLQSLTRSNVQTNYGARAKSAEALGQYGADTMMPELAGQSLSELAPRGLARIGSGMAAGGAFLNPATLSALPLTSPRLMGEAAYGAGRVSGGVNRLADLLYQPGMEEVPSLARAGLVNLGTR